MIEDENLSIIIYLFIKRGNSISGILTPLGKELANLPVEPFFLIFRPFLKIEEQMKAL